MDFQDCIDFILDDPHCALATDDNGQPRVRGLQALWARKEGIYFTTAATKELYRQMARNPKVELCFIKYNPIRHLRVTGEVDFVEDISEKQKALNERPILRSLGLREAADPNFILFRVAHGEAHFWKWADNLKEADIPRIVF